MHTDRWRTRRVFEIGDEQLADAPVAEEEVAESAAASVAEIHRPTSLPAAPPAQPAPLGGEFSFER